MLYALHYLSWLDYENYENLLKNFCCSVYLQLVVGVRDFTSQLGGTHLAKSFRRHVVHVSCNYQNLAHRAQSFWRHVIDVSCNYQCLVQSCNPPTFHRDELTLSMIYCNVMARIGVHMPSFLDRKKKLSLETMKQSCLAPLPASFGPLL